MISLSGGAATTAAVPGSERDGGAARRPRVLVVEGDGTTRDGLVLTLARGGYDVLGLADGHDFMGYLSCCVFSGTAERPADVVVAALTLDGPGGLEILSTLRSGGCRTPVVLLAGENDRDADTPARAYRLGASAVLAKPFPVAELRARVEEALLFG